MSRVAVSLAFGCFSEANSELQTAAHDRATTAQSILVRRITDASGHPTNQVISLLP